ncbi:MAG: YfhO family protein [Bacteroidia bacterium]|nr:YfhO family protein [Bacteroidia bacterium]MBT8276549.1 YfhO family protein [Bacteroidia bacterium]NNK54351.1 YfhO family protein [Flavobacteriaceae bacterium]NNM09088.1 YfhO family protein [Flavobacteriaceae bacterium]
MQRIKDFLPHLIVLVLFLIASLAYFNPVLQGKKIFQSDIVQYTGMAKQQNDYRKASGEETYWTNSAFGGMPTYQLGAKYPHNYIKKLDLTLRFLPRPADYLFLYFISIYILFLVLKVDFRLAFLGALAFGFSTYLIIILGVGHNAKAHAIAYMPLVLSGVILTFRGKYLWGFILTTIALALEFVANHFQMTYYLLLLVLCIGVAYLVDAYRKKMLPHFFKSVAIMLLGVLIAVGLNATNIMATKEYADTSTRGKSELTILPDGSPKQDGDGLSYEYITEYSYGPLETFNLFIPRFMGGGTSEPLPQDGETLDALIRLGASPQEANEILGQLPVYWGDQPIVAAPAYIGAITIFLAVLALFLVKGRIKWWITAAFLLSLFLSWGRNFSFLTELFIDYIPLYDKFRAVSSIQVIIELVVPILAVVGLHQYFNDFVKEEARKKALLWAVGITGGIALVFLLFKSAIPGLDFASPYDQELRDQLGTPLVEAIRDDRASLFVTDTMRTLIFVLLAAVALWMFLKEKLKQNTVIAILAVLVIIDLVGVNWRYVNNDDFVNARIMNQPFQKNPADIQILEDEGHFRVYDITTNPFSSGRASYFHNALGGYHAAKPGRMQDLDDYFLADGDIGILNMMNVRYIIGQSPNGGPVAQRNPFTNGNAWFVENVLIAENANEELLLLDSLDTKKTVVIHNEFKEGLPLDNIVRDSTATIDLTEVRPDYMVYESSSKSPQLAVFSEVYYPKGWNAYLNGEAVEYIRANYVLRAMALPAGNHKIEFRFEPKVIQTGSTISLSSFILLILILAGGLWYYRKQEKNDSEETV